jgi:hypothetical protein
MSDVVDHGVDVHAKTYFASVAGRAVRATALLVLAFAALTIVLSWVPAQRSTQDLGADLADGRASYVEYVPATRTVRWVVDRVLWRETRLPARSDVSAPGNPGGQDMTWLGQRITDSGHQVRLTEVDNPGDRLWVMLVPWPPLAFAAGAAWLLALVHMLATGGHRVANRWAWLWMFIFGQVGVALYLLCEPAPLWRSELSVLGRRPIRGGMGILYAVLLAGAASVLGVFTRLALR